jgi:hypothetical protein
MKLEKLTSAMEPKIQQNSFETVSIYAQYIKQVSLF